MHLFLDFKKLEHFLNELCPLALVGYRRHQIQKKHRGKIEKKAIENLKKLFYTSIFVIKKYVASFPSNLICYSFLSNCCKYLTSSTVYLLTYKYIKGVIQGFLEYFREENLVDMHVYQRSLSKSGKADVCSLDRRSVFMRHTTSPNKILLKKYIC